MLDQERVEELIQLTARSTSNLWERLVQNFVVEVPIRLEKMRDSQARGDITEYHSLVHSLGGICGNIGAMRMCGIARILQKSQTFPPEPDHILERFHEEFETVTPLLLNAMFTSVERGS